MSSVISFEKCPICKQEEAMHVDFNVRTQEEHGFCMICGFKYGHEYIRDDDGNVIQPAKLQETEDYAAGVINVTYQNCRLEQVIRIPRYSTEADVRDKMDEIIKEHDVEEIYATWFDEKHKIIKRLE